MGLPRVILLTEYSRIGSPQRNHVQQKNLIGREIMAMNRREFIAASAAGSAILRAPIKAFAASTGNIQATIDASKSGAPISPMIFGGYMEPATTQVWAEVLTDRKFANAITSAPTPLPTNPFFRRFFGEPFKPVGPEGTVEMDTERPFVGKHSPRVKLDSSRAPRHTAIATSHWQRKTYEGRVFLAGDPGAKIRFAWSGGRAPATPKASPSHRLPESTGSSLSSSLPLPTPKKRVWKSWAPAPAHFTSAPCL